jgi:hypothetical protein
MRISLVGVPGAGPKLQLDGGCDHAALNSSHIDVDRPLVNPFIGRAHLVDAVVTQASVQLIT